MRPVHGRGRQVAELRHDVEPDDAPEGLDGLRTAVDLDMRAQVARREIGHRRLRQPLGRHRVLAALDAVDHDHRLAPRGIGPDFAVAADDGALRAGRTARLDDEDLAPGAVDAHAEAREVAAPEQRVAVLGRQRIDGAHGELDGVSRHVRFP